MIVPEHVPDVDETYEFDVADQRFLIEVRDGQVSFARGRAANPTLTIECDADTFVSVGARMLSPFVALATGEVRIKGEQTRSAACTRMLGLS